MNKITCHVIFRILIHVLIFFKGFWRTAIMGNYVTRDDFEWSSQEEPHAKRRVEILSMFNIFHNQPIILEWNSNFYTDWFQNISILFPEKYPQIKELFGVDPMFKWKVIALTFIQLCMLFVIQKQSWLVTIFLAYCFGGVINHALMLGMILMKHKIII